MNNEASEKSVEGDRFNNVQDLARSVSDIFAETASRVEDVDTSCDEYFNCQLSGRMASSPSFSLTPPHSNFFCSSPNLDLE